MKFHVLLSGAALLSTLLTGGCTVEGGSGDDDDGSEQEQSKAGPYNLAGRWQFSGVDQQGIPRDFGLTMSGAGTQFAVEFEVAAVAGTATVSNSSVTIVGDEAGVPYTMNGTITSDGRTVSGQWSYDDQSNSGTFELTRQSYDLSGGWSFEGIDRSGTPRSFAASFAPSAAGWSLEGVSGVTGQIDLSGGAVTVAGDEAGVGYTMSGSIDPTATRIAGSWSYDDGSNDGSFTFSR